MNTPKSVVLTFKEVKGYASIQDLGRPQAQHYGFSVSGAADEFAFLQANKLLENPLNNAVLEIILGQISLTTNKDIKFSITGADCQAYIENNGAKQTIKPWQSYLLKANQILTLKQPQKGLISYISFAGAFNCKKFSNSLSQTIAEHTLELTQQKITTNTQLSITANEQQTEQTNNKNHHTLLNSVENFYQLEHNQPLTLRFIPSPLWQKLPAPEQELFLQQEFAIQADSNRMGYRLSNHPILSLQKTSKNQLSKAVCYGAIQYPANNQPIILMKERQTIGGYPILGTVMQTDLFRLSQKRPGEKVKFTPIGIEQAQQQLLSFYQRF